jgi:hypothetical protein
VASFNKMGLLFFLGSDVHISKTSIIVRLVGILTGHGIYSIAGHGTEARECLRFSVVGTSCGMSWPAYSIKTIESLFQVSYCYCAMLMDHGCRMVPLALSWTSVLINILVDVNPGRPERIVHTDSAGSTTSALLTNAGDWVQIGRLRQGEHVAPCRWMISAAEDIDE